MTYLKKDFLVKPIPWEARLHASSTSFRSSSMESFVGRPKVVPFSTLP